MIEVVDAFVRVTTQRFPDELGAVISYYVVRLKLFERQLAGHRRVYPSPDGELDSPIEEMVG